jgi:CTP synthase (UTP-ammonia lyase)
MALGDRDPAFLTHREIDATLALLPAGVADGWTSTDSQEARDLAAVDGVWLLPGTPYRDEQAAQDAIRHCLRSGAPFLGTCGGFQHACLTLVRDLAGVSGAAHAETEPEAAQQAIRPLACSLYGAVREVRPVPGTRLAAICGTEPFDGYHYCGYGLADEYAAGLQSAGVIVSAVGDDAGTEAIELPGHPFFLATAFQPQVGAAASGRLGAVVSAFLQAAATRAVDRGSRAPAGRNA